MKNSEQKNYKWDAKFYAANSKAQLSWAKELLEKLNLSVYENLLDIGCGDGKITAELARQLQNGKVIGIDSSEQMINFAAASFPKEHYPNLDFILLDACNINYENMFDVIFSNAALHWVKDHRSLLKKIYSALKSGGRILLQMGGKGNCVDVMKVVHVTIESNKWGKYYKGFEFPYGFYGDDEYRAWLSEAGFVIDNVALIQKDMQHVGKEGLTGWFRSTWLPYLERIPGRLEDDFINEVIGDYLQDYPIDDEGKTHVKMMRLQVEAHKL